MCMSDHRILKAKPISPELFAPFGHIISASLQAGKEANQGTAIRCDFCAPLLSTRPGAKANLVAVRAMPQALPLKLRLFEHHPCSTQSFIPMICSRYLIIVAQATQNGAPDLDTIAAFVCGPGQGISYGAGVWHHPIAALDMPTEFAMLVWEDGTALDCVEWPLKEDIFVSL